jgi:hypothetical protein
MAARTPRRSFAAPFVVTLAATAPACYVSSSPQGSAQPTPTTQTQTQTQTQPEQPEPAPGPGGPVVMNPPMPQAPAPAAGTKWTVYRAKDGCKAAYVVDCPAGAMCNPPPPSDYECPQNVSLDKPVTVASDGTGCFVQYEMPKCPPGVACNPPRPQPVTCPR